MKYETRACRIKISVITHTLVFLLFPCLVVSQTVITGELKKWHKLTLTFSSGINTGETATPNPFTDYRLNVTFTNGANTYLVPGYYAADGNASETSATNGDKWRVHFSPDEIGIWTYTVSFRTGSYISINENPAAGSPVAPLNGISGSFNIQPTDKSGRDHRAKGRLQYVGEHYMRFAETDEYYIKGACNSPENFLGYHEFDGTYDNGNMSPNTPDGLHHYPTHVADWNTGDPTWQNGKGKGIIGALNYLASEEITGMYFLTMNIDGDGDDTWPYISHNVQDFERFDCSKLDQWEIVFSHMDSIGLMIHFVTQERENQMLLDNGALGNHRKMYYRELIARFSHHLAITWNMGEENGWDYLGRGTQTDQQRKDMATYFKTHDPYQNFVVIHTYTDDHDLIYLPLLGYPDYEGTSMQTYHTNVHEYTLLWLQRSANAGKKWVVNHDETVGGINPNGPGNGHTTMRRYALYGNLMAGGGGVEWYFGEDDLTEENLRSRSGMWSSTRHALRFFNEHLPFWEMKNNPGLLNNSFYVFEKPGRIYAIYSIWGSSTGITLPCGNYTVKWYDPHNGGSLQDGSVTTVNGGGFANLGSRPYTNNDWMILVTNNFNVEFNVTHVGCGQNQGGITATGTGGVAPYSYSWNTGAVGASISALAAGTYTVTVTDNSGCTISESVEILQTAQASVNLKAFIEGPYNATTGLMSDDLRVAGVLPLNEPFTGLGYTHAGPGGGETVSPSVFSITGNNAIVDWIFVELRDKNNVANIIATRAALLQRDGDIVDVDGLQPLTFNGIPCEDYYIAVRHRNHLGFMTAGTYSLSSTLTLDLSSTAISLYGTNAQKTVSGKRVMWTGNANNNHQLKYIGADNDRDLILNTVGASTPTSVIAGYHNEDLNLDGYVKYMGVNNDRDLILLNIGGSTPGAVRIEQLP